MTIGQFTDVLHKTRCFHISAGKLTAALFDAAGSRQSPVSENTAKSWNNGRRSCNVKEHFPDGKISEFGLIHYIEDHIRESWSDLKNGFRQLVDDNCVINFDTKDGDVFYWSMMNQFQKICYLPLSDEPEALMRMRFKQAVQNYGISEISISFRAT